ncbi:low molecular weight neuronal intermediate filament-like isoform X2 [Branchiostoma floridae]|uniref:Low molecular weight neuronal intermediate filament-like isoform X2 n=1 Tax=Branchiostoma floridae TaxID=7739 RepID=A0A9J7N299_BRAFL|nr:low molecular weight neuronal intermediate filament-like isoform X2 [Branchiostoma floridae]
MTMTVKLSTRLLCFGQQGKMSTSSCRRLRGPYPDPVGRRARLQRVPCSLPLPPCDPPSPVSSSEILSPTRTMSPSMSPPNTTSAERTSTYVSRSVSYSGLSSSYHRPSTAFTRWSSIHSVKDMSSSSSSVPDQSKYEMKQLNTRFMSYIKRVHFLEDQNKLLKDQITLLELGDTKGAELKKEMRELRERCAEQAESERKLDSENRKLRHDLRDMEVELLNFDKRSTCSESSDNPPTMEDLEREKSHLSEECDRLRRDAQEYKAKWEDESKMRAKIGEDLSRTRQELAKLKVDRDDLERRLTREQEEGQLMRLRVEEKKSELETEKDKQAEAALKKKMEELSSCVQKYHVELTETLQRMSVQQEDSARMSKQELEQWYRTQLEEAKAAAAKDAETLTETRDALLQSETLVGHLSDEIDMLRSQNSSLSKQLQEAEKAVDENTVKYEENIRVLETELQALKEDTATQIMEIVHHVMSLTNARVALDLQMDSYFDILGKRKSDTTEADTVKKQKSLVLPALPIAEDNRVPMDTSDACAQDCMSDENANTSPIMADEVAAGSGH